ncbi:spore cortex-lytic enzyme [Litoribacterium kuwaitense]|uniref:spore cortex-lytic enzyme n=1 Tax=Litoribacterium kuwaitense TaxID=1398745 RepID=UPI0028A86E6F|nr:spore cortex-lytic enzyme [Litoribacterium kuwaitense]
MIIAVCLVLSLSQTASVQAFTNQVIQKGAVGDDVIELQSRLQYIGFYQSQIDGKFGWSTYWALRNFQEDFGLDIDGLAGPQTKEKLVNASQYDEPYVKNYLNSGKRFTYYGGSYKKNQSGGKQNNSSGEKQQSPGQQQPSGGGGKQPTKPVNVPAGYSENDIQLMANAVHGEARGEPYEGMVAVAGVILNRINSATFPDSVSGVIFEPRAFTAVADGQIWLTPNETSKRAVLDAINGWDPSSGALYYFNPDTATSPWIWTRPQIKQIGAHIFCK